jgi:N-acetyl-gamma-glutamyl-phosphate reductase
MNQIKIAIIGITGYAGEELLKIFARHPRARVSCISSRSKEKAMPVKDLYPHLGEQELMVENINTDALCDRADVVFLAVPHRVSLELVPGIVQNKKKVIDLSADFRLNNSSEYEKWYNEKHTASHLLKQAVYGLPELYRPQIKHADIVANPGCYPTSSILALAPLMKKSLVDLDSIIIDAKSGISGAGRKESEEYFKKDHPDARAYKIAGHHRHIPEVEQELSKLAGREIKVTFTPHVIPVERGMLTTVYANLEKTITPKEALALFSEFYKDEPFVRVLPEGQLPRMKNVVNTNFCELGLSVDERTGRIIIVSSLDNLVKGASGQAVQNMNIMFNLNETSGLI